MSLFDRFKSKTVEDIVDTAKSAVTETVKNGLDDRVRGALYVLPVLVSAWMIFRSEPQKEKENNTVPRNVTINNYYAEREEERHAD